MKSALIIGKKNEYIKFIAFLLSQNSEEVIIIESLSEAIITLDSKKYNFIFIGKALNVDGDISKLSEKIKKGITEGAVLFGENNAVKKLNPDCYISSIEGYDRINQKIKNILQDNGNSSEYIELTSKSFQYEMVDALDIYINSGKNFFRISAFSNPDREAVKKYSNKIESFFVKSESYQKFLKELVLKIPLPYSEQSPMEILEDAMSFASGLLEDLNFKNEIRQEQENGIQNLVNAYMQIEDLLIADLNKKLFKSSANFSLKLNSLAIQLVVYVAKEFGFKDKLIYQMIKAVLVQNIFINDEPKLLRIYCEEMLADLSEDERTLVENHAFMAFNKIEKLPGFDGNICNMVKEHEGSFSGVGIFDSHQGENNSGYLKTINILSVIILEFYESDETELDALVLKIEKIKSKSHKKFHSIFDSVIRNFNVGNLG